MLYSLSDLTRHIAETGIKPSGTLLVHSSMKAIGEVEGGAQTVLDAFISYMKDGLLIFPTHTWNTINAENPVFDPQSEPSCVGLLSNLFLKQPGVVRSLHPTHSVAALGRDAAEYCAGEELTRTPCPRNGCWGKLYDRKAKILFLGAPLKTNTLIHGVEEWCGIEDRLAAEAEQLKIKMEDGSVIACPQYRHRSSGGDISRNYGKLLEPMLELGIAKQGKTGDADSVLCDVVPMVDLCVKLLEKKPDLFFEEGVVSFF